LTLKNYDSFAGVIIAMKMSDWRNSTNFLRDREKQCPLAILRILLLYCDHKSEAVASACGFEAGDPGVIQIQVCALLCAFVLVKSN